MMRLLESGFTVYPFLSVLGDDENIQIEFIPVILKVKFRPEYTFVQGNV